MKILVTGSSGYIGGNFINIYKTKYSFNTFSILKNNLNKIDWDNIDIVLHCAALVHQKKQYDYNKYYEVNVKYTIDLAKKAKENKIKQFIFISTIAVYEEEYNILNENINCKPITPYGESKLEAEKELKKLEDNSFIVSIIRPPMVYGKNAPGNINSLIKLVKKMPILPLGQIKNKRSFIYIGNLCHLIDVIIQKQQNGIFLASDNESISTTRLIELIAKELNKKVYLIKIPFFEDFIKLIKPSFYKRLFESLEVDNSITKKRLNFKNIYSVEDGIKYMINSV